MEVYKAGAEKPSAQIKSNWVMLDAQTRRMKRVPPELAARFEREFDQRGAAGGIALGQEQSLDRRE